MATFKLNITGMCAFSPGASSKTVILGNLRDQGREPHFPFILADRDSAVTTGGARPFDNRDLDQGAGNFGYTRMVGWLLEGEDLTLSPLIEAFSVAPGPAPNATCPTSTDRDGFGWVASMARAEGAQLDPDVLTTEETDRVLARLRLDRGRLATAEFAGFPGAPFRWAYLQDGNQDADHPRRAIAEVVQLTATFSGNLVRIHSHRFNGTALPDIVLQGGSLTAWLVNMPLPDILQNRPGEHPTHPHFRHFYRLSTRPGGLRFPHSQGRCQQPVDSLLQRPKGLDPAPTNPKCPPAMFES